MGLPSVGAVLGAAPPLLSFTHIEGKMSKGLAFHLWTTSFALNESGLSMPHVALCLSLANVNCFRIMIFHLAVKVSLMQELLRCMKSGSLVSGSELPGIAPRLPWRALCQCLEPRFPILTLWFAGIVRREETIESSRASTFLWKLVSPPG